MREDKSRGEIEVKKKIVSRCQDITEADLVRAIREGFNHLEMLKRYTGVLMGSCQGKMCGTHVIRIFAKQTGVLIEDLNMPTLRPPADPIPLGCLVAGDTGDDDEKTI